MYVYIYEKPKIKHDVYTIYMRIPWKDQNKNSENKNKNKNWKNKQYNGNQRLSKRTQRNQNNCPTRRPSRPALPPRSIVRSKPSPRPTLFVCPLQPRKSHAWRSPPECHQPATSGVRTTPSGVGAFLRLLMPSTVSHPWTFSLCMGREHGMHHGAREPF